MNASQTITIATRDPRSPRARIGIAPADLARGAYLVGRTGTGKSALMLRLALGAVGAGFGVCVLDPHGDLAKVFLANLPRRYWNRTAVFRASETERPVGLNIMRPSGAPIPIIASGIVEVFRRLWGKELFGPRSEHVLRNAVLALAEMPGATLLGLARMLVDSDYRSRVVARVQDPAVTLFWTREFPSLGKAFTAEVTAPLLNKIGTMSAPTVRRIVGQVAPRLDLREVMDQQGILVCDLSGVGRDAAQILGAITVTGLDLAATSRAGSDPATRGRFLVICDEFQTYATRSFLTLLAEDRKFGVSAILAHQNMGQLDPETRAAILGNAGTLGAFSLSAEDARLLAPELAPDVSAEELVRMKRYQMALRLFRDGEPARPVICRTLPPPPESREPPTLLRISSERYGRPVEVVDREIAETLGQADKKTGLSWERAGGEAGVRASGRRAPSPSRSPNG